jgi:hypothetical protein
MGLHSYHYWVANKRETWVFESAYQPSQPLLVVRYRCTGVWGAMSRLHCVQRTELTEQWPFAAALHWHSR